MIQAGQWVRSASDGVTMAKVIDIRTAPISGRQVVDLEVSSGAGNYLDTCYGDECINSWDVVWG